MSEVVVDTNVWVMVDEIVADMETDEEKLCILACQDWLEQFSANEDSLVVDGFQTYLILSEYRRNVRAGGVAESLLNDLSGHLFHRLVLKPIGLDEDGNAILPPPFSLTHGKDRKFVAVAIQCDPYATIHYATDIGWAHDREQLESNGLTIHELCPDYIDQRMLSR